MLLRGFPALFRLFWPGKFHHSTKQAPLFLELAAGTGQHRASPALWYFLPHPLQNRVPRGASHLWRSAAPVSAPTSVGAELSPLVNSTPAGSRDKSFCPCHKTGGNSGFLPVFFLHVLHGNGVRFGSDSGFSHPFAPVSNRSHPLQHPKRTRFRLFLAESGALFSFSLLSGRKIFALVFVQPAA